MISFKDKAACARNMRRTWCVPVSALAFFALSFKGGAHYAAGIVPAALAVVAACAGGALHPGEFRAASWRMKAFLAASTLGIVANAALRADAKWADERHVAALLGGSAHVAVSALCVLCAACAAPFVYAALTVFWREFRRAAGGASVRGFFRTLPRAERAVYAALLAATLALVAIAFTRTNVFYEAEGIPNVVYTSDSPVIVMKNAYLSLDHGENDIRQPLFAVFSAPLLAAPYALSLPFRAVPWALPLLLGWAQAALLLAGAVVLARAAARTSLCRAALTVFLCSTYTYLLFSLMLEQYVVMFFYLMLFISRACAASAARPESAEPAGGNPGAFLFYAASGTLVTNVVLAPLLGTEHPLRRFPRWLLQMALLAAGYLALIVLFCRLNTVTELVSSFRAYRDFTAAHVPYDAVLRQYLAFVPGCFYAAPTLEFFGTWQLNMVRTVSPAGIVLLALSALSALVCRRDALVRVAACWAAFSFLLLGAFGWGTGENGLVLYSLYFCWAFAVLLYKLADAAARKIHAEAAAVPCALAALFLLAHNIPKIQALIAFGVETYPL